MCVCVCALSQVNVFKCLWRQTIAKEQETTINSGAIYKYHKYICANFKNKRFEKLIYLK